MSKIVVCLIFFVCLPLTLLAQDFEKVTSQAYYAEASQERFAAVPAAGQNLHVVLAIDTDADTPSLNLYLDGVHMLELLEYLFPNHRSGAHELATIKVLAGTECNPKTIIETITQLETDERDTVLFYYSGHGATDRNEFFRNADQRQGDGTDYDDDHGQFLATTHGNLSRSCLKEALRSRPAQLRILITDCCANFSNLSTAKESLKSAKKHRSNSTVRPTRNPKIPKPKLTQPESVCEQLFFDTIGWVSVNAAPPSQTALGSSKGGFMTLGMIARLKEFEQLGLGIDWEIAHVKTNEYSANNPYPFEGGVVNGAEEPGFVYSYIYSKGIKLSQITARPENESGPMYEHPKNTLVTIKIGFGFSNDRETTFQDGRMLRADESPDANRPFARFYSSFTGDRAFDSAPIFLKAGNQFLFGCSGKPLVGAASERYNTPVHVKQLICFEAYGNTPPRKLDSSVFPWAYISFYYPGSPRYEPTLDDFRRSMGDYLTIETK